MRKSALPILKSSVISQTILTLGKRWYQWRKIYLEVSSFGNDNAYNKNFPQSPSLEIEFLSNYLAELTLLECSLLSFVPSLIAASAVYLSLLTLDFKTCP